jgi:hypothetical protein
MHVDEVLRAGGLMQGVDILRHGQNVALVVFLELGEREVRLIRPRLFQPAAAEIVELVHLDRLRAKPSVVATSSRLKRVHKPSLPRNVPSPLSAESPAPVRMTMELKRIRFAAGLAFAGLAAMAEVVVGEHDCHHRLADRHGADADARVMAALCRDLGLVALSVHGLARRQD